MKNGTVAIAYLAHYLPEGIVNAAFSKINTFVLVAAM